MIRNDIMDKFILPKERIPKPFSQSTSNNMVGSCAACSLTELLEVYLYKVTGQYVYLSKGYTYGRNNYPGKRTPGMSFSYALPLMLERGTVPEYICNTYGEFPEIAKELEKREDILSLDEIARSIKFKSFKSIFGKNSREMFENVKAYLQSTNMPVLVSLRQYKGEKHAVLAIGYEGDYILWHDHDGTDEVKRTKYTGFYEAYYGEGDEERMSVFKLFTKDEFKEYIQNLKVTRKITTVQLHHTYMPDYSSFNGSNHTGLQTNMKKYHMNTNGWSDIGQNFTIFPDGKIMTGRDINTAPAGIYGANAKGICIECLGNFDKEEMTAAQKDAVISAVSTLLERFSLDAQSGVTYHAWWTADGKYLGDYIKGKSAKTCPGTKFFGGNTRKAFETNLLPKLKEEILMAKFNDTVGHWAEKTIDELAEMGIVHGKTETEFKPDDTITRAEAAMLIRNAIRYVTGK